MSSSSMKLKAKIKNYAKENHIAAQVVLQNYMFERFLERLSKTEHKEKFIVKGGMLIASIVGLDTRSTMDLDATIKNTPLTEANIIKIIKEICEIELDDNVIFKTISIHPIRKDDLYGGYVVRLDAIFESIITPLSIDVSCGDVITPSAIQYSFNSMFDENVKINLWGYNIETILAEKAETILNRGIFTTRPKDYYDIYILTKTQSFNKSIFKEALHATSIHRNSLDIINNQTNIINQLEHNKDLKTMWSKYQNKFYYAKDINFEELIEAIKTLF